MILLFYRFLIHLLINQLNHQVQSLQNTNQSTKIIASFCMNNSIPQILHQNNMKTSRLERNLKENDETKLLEEEFNEDLYNIDQIKTSYLQDWNSNKDWMDSPRKLKEIEKKQVNIEVDSSKMTSKKRSISLPLISSIQLPLFNPLNSQSFQSKKPQVRVFEPFQNSHVLTSKLIYDQKDIDPRTIKRRIQIQKKIINQINQEIHKARQHELRKFSSGLKNQPQILMSCKKTAQNKSDSLNLKTKKILDSYSKKIDVLGQNQHHQDESKNVSKKSSIGKILKKYEKTHQSSIQDQILKLRSKEAEYRRNYIKELALQQRKSSLHSSLQNYLAFQKAKEKIGVSLLKPNYKNH